jgi:hypothetical protein
MNILCDLTPNDIGISGLIVAVICAFTALGFVRGVVKLIFLLFTIAGTGYAAYWGSYEGLSYLQRSWAGAPGQLAHVFAAICGLVSFYLLSKIFGFFTDPFQNTDFLSRFAFGVPAALVSLIAVISLIWLSLNFLKDKGAEGEIKYLITQDDKDEDARMKSYPTLANLKQRFESVGMGQSMANIYKLHDTEKYTLIKLLVISLTDPERTKQLAEIDHVRSVMRHSQVRAMMSDIATRKQVANNDVQGLLVNSLIIEALKDKRLREDLAPIKQEQLR